MPRVCTVCSHPKRNEIDTALAQPFTVKRRIAKQHGLHPSAVERHALEHLPPRIAAAASNGNALSARSLLERVTSLIEKLEMLTERAADGGDAETLVDAAAQLRPTLELLGRVTRELQPETAINLQVGLFQRLGVKDEDEARRRLEAVSEFEGLSESAVAERMRSWLARYDAANAQQGPRLNSGSTNGTELVSERSGRLPFVAPERSVEFP